MDAKERLDIVTRITDATLSRRDLPGFFDAISQVTRDLFPAADDFGIARYDEARHQFEIVATSPHKGEQTNLGVRTPDAPDTPGGFLLRTGKTTMVNDMDAFEAQGGFDMRRLFPRGFESGIGALLERQGRVLGYLYVTSARKNVFEERHREIFDLIRGILSLAFENALAYEELSRLKDQAEQQGEYLRAEIQANWPADGLIGRSRLWKDVLSQISQVAQTDSTVLIQGETGTGKEVIARVIHERSRRTRKPLIKINCGALPENLVESELFGHERGSFTGAMGRRIGRFELANGGTIFLDEIGEMTMPLQVKLLRVLQEREFERVGGEKPIRVDVRVLTATNRDLSTEVAAGRFRADLFYRINVFPINIPPLRMRPEDASHLAQYFVQRIGERLGRRGMTLSPASLQAAQAYSWPGNVRELEHLIERGIILARGNLVDLQGLLMPGAGSAAFPGTMAAAPLPPAPEPVAPGAGSLKDNIADAERSAILTALEASGGVLGGESGAAARLGMKRQTLQSKMKKLRIVAKGTADGPGEAI